MKLQSIENFQASPLSETTLNSLMGGNYAPPVGDSQMTSPTQGGSFCSSLSSTGCVAYTSDTTITTHNAITGKDSYSTTNHGTSEVQVPCN